MKTYIFQANYDFCFVKKLGQTPEGGVQEAEALSFPQEAFVNGLRQINTTYGTLCGRAKKNRNLGFCDEYL